MHSFIRWAKGVLPLAFFVAAPMLWAQPQLTTIDDVIYRADGGRFDGSALIEWRTFLLADYTAVAAYSKAVRIVNGSIRVSLTPTTTASAGSHYQVRYVSNGRVLYTEYWGVPPSQSTLKLKDVRLAGPPLGGQIQDPVGSGPVTIPDVTGLADELNSRAKKGLGYLPQYAAVINSAGELESAMGEPTDCVHVNGTSGPCSVSTGPAFVDFTSPAGLVNGTNNTFTLDNPPTPASSLQLYRNGLLQSPGTDYTLAGNVITFAAGAIPQTGDLLRASYRLAGSGGSTGEQAGGALSGYYPAPSIAPGAISDQHISPGAAIQESKLALAYPTHSNANDPTAEQKAALAGTAGTPSGGNRFVTSQDPRLTDSRTPAGHAMLSSAHSDTNPGVVGRGDLMVGMGTAPTLWTRLALGASNRCLTSNGFDVVWNACLFTGFPVGAIPFVDSTGNLSHNQSRLHWDNSTRRLGVGVSPASSTLTVYDSSAGNGVTTLSVRAGDNQQSTPLQEWQNSSATGVARLESDGTLMAAAVRATSTASQAAWQENGSATDPSSPQEGSFWLNTTEKARKSVEDGQVHSVPQVLCAVAGTATSSTTTTTLGTCTVPAGLLREGDRLDIHADLSHEGASASFSFALNWGTINLTARSGSGSEATMSAKSEVLPASGRLQWNWQSWGTETSMLAGGGTNTNPPAGSTVIEVAAQMSTPTSETVTLRNLTVIRIPAQANP